MNRENCLFVVYASIHPETASKPQKGGLYAPKWDRLMITEKVGLMQKGQEFRAIICYRAPD